MKIELPLGVIIFMAVINTALLILALIGFINLKYIIKEIKRRLAKIILEQSTLK